MYNLLEALFTLLTAILRAVVDILSLLFGFPFEFSEKGTTKYNNRMLGLWDRWKLLRRSYKSVSLSGKLQLDSLSSNEGVLVVGGSGSGKTSIIGIASALKLENSFVIIDVDGKVWDSTSRHNKERGFDVRRINLSEPSLSDRIEFVRMCQNQSDINMLAENIMYNEFSRSSGGDSKFWEFGAISVLKITIALVLRQPEEFQSLSNVRFLLQRFNQLEHFISAIGSEETWGEYLAFSSADEKVKAGFIQQALMAVNKFGDPGLAYITGATTLEYSDLITQKSAWYIQVSEAQIPYYSAFLTLLFSTLFEFIQTNKSNKQLTLIIDEAGQIPIKNLPIILTTMRKYCCSAVIMLQDVEQVSRFYGREGKSAILSGACAHKVVFPGVSIGFARELSESFGRKAFGSVRNEDGYIHDSREVLSPTDIIQGKKNHALYFYRNKPPYLMRMHPFYKQWRLRRLSKKKPVASVRNEVVRPPVIPITNPINPSI